MIEIPTHTKGGRKISWLKRQRLKGEWLGLHALVAIGGALPFWALKPVADFLGGIGYRVDRRGRERALENLQVAFANRFDENERKDMILRSYREFALTFLQLFWSPNVTHENYQKYIDIELEDEAATQKALDEGAIWMTPHYANFEWTALAASCMGAKLTIIAEDFKNPSLTDIFKNVRQSSGHEIISQDRAMIKLLKTLKRHDHCAFLADLNVPVNSASTIVEYFGLKVSVPLLQALLATRTGAPVVPSISRFDDTGRNQLLVLKPMYFAKGADLQQVTQQIWDVLEPHISQDPAPWMWMYKHWRYLSKWKSDSYPSYARRNDDFSAKEEEIFGQPVDS